jgi:4-carboxymuconolactone decarboxylase
MWRPFPKPIPQDSLIAKPDRQRRNGLIDEVERSRAMTRIPAVAPDELTPEQRRVHDEIIATRPGGEIRGPFAIWIRNPKLAAAANQLGNAVRLEGKLDPKLFELVVLRIARHWSAQYEWHAHANEALRVGLDASIIEAIRAHRVPTFAGPEETLAYELVGELLETRDVSAATYARALGMFGFDLVTEIVTIAGFYTLVAMMLKAFDAPVPGNARPLD